MQLNTESLFKLPFTEFLQTYSNCFHPSRIDYSKIITVSITATIALTYIPSKNV